MTTTDDSSRLFLLAGGRERTALLRDGLAREVLPGVLVPADVPVTRQLRARAVREKLGDWETDAGRGRSVGFGTAAWLHTGACPRSNTAAGARHPLPERLDLIIGRNRRSPALAGVRVRQVDMPPEHLQTIEGLLVTHPLRTSADIARDLPRAEALPLLRLLQEFHDVHPPQVLELLGAMSYARGAARARDVVRDWAEMA
ncbi:hypothetical protein GCM10022223_65870 [Kineosporia mesophila]|uniref:AbiEi antitoxin C-terminal domain-containing protein n=1 Tax=Kineosporia mesophila TaxID=566012 RepID=A0ABP7AQW4_9ACTN|nr:hypothetical protein [Kineosporia mesophila]MCD5349163.1 hypothetical protein [Kineosporia mesophila]